MKRLIFSLACMAFFISCEDKTKTAESSSTADSTGTATSVNSNYEFADPKFKEIARSGQQYLVTGDVDTWMNNYADNAVYRWSNGDSLAGKAAISAYWKKRRTEVLDSLAFSNDVWLPVKVITPEAATQLPGNYCLA